MKHRVYSFIYESVVYPWTTSIAS